MDRFLYDNGLRHERVKSLNPFHATGLFVYPLKTSENFWYPDVSREYRRSKWYEMSSYVISYPQSSASRSEFGMLHVYF